jgi:hypothetical protein
MLPRIAIEHGCAIEELLCLRNLTFGMGSIAGTTSEFDAVICYRDSSVTTCSHPQYDIDDDHDDDSDKKKKKEKPLPKKGSFVRVLGIVEVKSNANDIANAYRSISNSLHWLSSNIHRYDPVDFITKGYPRGHFDKTFSHNHGGETFLFTSESFSACHQPVPIPKPITVPISASSVSVVPMPPVVMSKEEERDEEEDEEEKRKSLCDCTFLSSIFFVSKECRLEGICSKESAWIMAHISSSEQIDDDCSDPIELERVRLRAIGRFYDTEGREEEGEKRE